MKKRGGRVQIGLAGLVILFVAICGLILPVLLLKRQKTEWNTQRGYLSDIQVQPLYFGEEIYFSYRKPGEGEMTVTQADFIVHNKFQEYFAMEILYAHHFWPLDMEDAQLAQNENIWRLVYRFDNVAWLEVCLDSVTGVIYQIGYLEPQTYAFGLTGRSTEDMNAQMLWYSVETDAYRMVQQMALEYQGEEGTLLERVGCNYAAVTLKDGNIAVACWSDEPWWWQYMAIVDAKSYEEDGAGGSQLWREKAFAQVAYGSESAAAEAERP